MYIAVEGVHGIGKTTICRMLEKDLGFKFIPEFKDNLLPPPKIGPDGDTFLSQMWFLRQLIMKDNMMTNGGVYLSDRSHTSIFIYSKANMSEYQFEIFKTILNRSNLRQPDIEIILWSPDEVIMERIKTRNREGCGEEDFEYLKKINSEFKKYYEDFKIIRDIYLVDASGTLDETISKIKEIIKNKTKHLNR